MWHFENWDIIFLVSVLCGFLLLLHNAWGSALAVTVLFCCVSYVYCYYLASLENSPLSTPNLAVVVFLDRLKKLARVSYFYLKHLLILFQYYVNYYVPRSLRHLQKQSVTTMEKRGKLHYQLSRDSYAYSSASGSNAAEFNRINELSPILRKRPDHGHFVHANDNEFEENLSYGPTVTAEFYNKDSKNFLRKQTSTPILPKRNESSSDSKSKSNVSRSRETLDSNYFLTSLTARGSERHRENSMSLGRSENNGSEEFRELRGNSFNERGSPRMRLKANGVKSIHTVAGPLLMSTRYNIDSKIFLNASSPGLTSRVTQYAAENTDKFNYQSQYSTGQFPKINFSAKPTPLISPTLAKSRMPVTVRLAPPETVKYSPDRKKILSDVCAAENERSPTVVQVLKEISLKRHASSEDIASDIVKKQRTVEVCNGNLGEMTQKRSRDDSLKSDDDDSPRHKVIRPLKRSKAQSCYDILNSLGSSVHVNSGVKRKAIDTSRSGTPDLQKHFKSLDNIQNGNFRTPPRTATAFHAHRESFTKISQPKDTTRNDKTTDEQPPIRRLLSSSFTVDSMTPRSNAKDSVQADDTSMVEYNSGGNADAKKAQERLTDKLFMKAEPAMNDKFKTVIAERDAVRAKFATSEGDEIKKEDIVNMRRTSMRSRLESMFNVTTGQEANKINPDVVIQAEEVTSALNTNVASTTITPLATLNSSTIMTNINTSPIATSAVAPILVVTKTDKKTPKHVTFNLPNVESVVQTSVKNVSEIEQSLPTASVENSTKLTTAAAAAASSLNSVSALSTTISDTATTTSSCDENSMGTPSLKQSFLLPTSSNVVPTFATSAGSAVKVEDIQITSAATSNSNHNRIQNSTIPPSTNSIVSNNFKLTSFVTAKSAENSVQSTRSNSTFGISPGIGSSSTAMTNVSTDTHLTTCNNDNSTAVCTSQTVVDSITNNQFTTTATTSTTGTSGSFTSKSQSLSFDKPVAMQGFTSAASSTTSATLPSSNDASVTPNFSSFSTKPIITSATSSFSATSSALGLSNSTSPFVFGGGATSPLSTTPASKNSFSFGKSTSTTLPSMTVTGSTSSSAVESIATPTSFAIPSTGSTGTFGTSATPLFSGISTNINSGANGTLAQSKNNTTSAFATNGTSFTSSKATTATTATTTPLFPAVSAASVATTNVSTVPTFLNNLGGFGQNKTITSQATSASSTSPFGNGAPTFGNNSTLFPTSTPSAAPSTFGSPSPAMAPASLGTGNSKVTTSFNASNSFGLRSVNGPLFGNAALTNFGGSSTSFDAPSNGELAFSTANNNTPAFGNSVFGSPAVTTTSAPTIFGATNSPSVFGATSNNNSSSSSSNNNNNNNNLNAAFNFGATSAASQQNFSFGSNGSTGNAAGISAPFQFGQNSTTKPSEGFNFTAPTSTPTINFAGTGNPSFSAPTPGMFNMGSGSTAPRSRTARPRRQR